ncbi:rubredoxin [Roseospirillum parvum]|uniref:Rubredoxin n=1 Tax=Roseospirillum parvum TaxID=83401 RepID=A0A1G7UHU3_9PROT|nr:rubredoxin [Roseospirillum parvum]SDG47074.1 Rubredoxin [Roseospirillum parvum]
MSRIDPARRRLLVGLPALLAGVATGLGAGPARAAAKSATKPAYDPLNQVWRCTFNECDPYFYVPAKGDPENIVGSHPIPPGTAFEDLPKDWLCPVCGAPRSWFIKEKA